MAYTQAGIAVENQQVFGELKTALDAVFAPQAVGKFLRSMERSGLRIRDFAGVLHGARSGDVGVVCVGASRVLRGESVNAAHSCVRTSSVFRWLVDLGY